MQTELAKYGIALDEWSSWTSSYNCLFIETLEHRVLIDVGAGDISPSTGQLIPALHQEGIEPIDIDSVILTHCHPDHINGLTLEDGSEAFPNATYFMGQEEWVFWTSEKAAESLNEHVRDVMMSVVNRNLPVIKNRLELVAGEAEIIPGIQAVSAPGHTPGHIALRVHSNGRELLAVIDAFLHPIHVTHSEWAAAADFDPVLTVQTRRRLKEMATRDGSLVLGFHFPFPGLGHFAEDGNNWVPLPKS